MTPMPIPHDNAPGEHASAYAIEELERLHQELISQEQRDFSEMVRLRWAIGWVMDNLTTTQQAAFIIDSPLAFYAATGGVSWALGFELLTRPMALAGTIMLASSSIAKASSV